MVDDPPRTDQLVDLLRREPRTFAAYGESGGRLIGYGVILTPSEAKGLLDYIEWLERPDDLPWKAR